ncbi:MAG: twin-arginine translocase TatA/TatE family subunit [Candidatus Omnitrophica bacterium]|nr:twin-arginine translocase TatA/TatE family subunit [Candidatus Omnitrophota bacterium]
MPTIGFWELVLILLIVLLVFGAAKLPEIGRAMGKAIREFKKAAGEAGKDDAEKDKDKVSSKDL